MCYINKTNLKLDGFCASPLFLQTLISKWNAKCTFIWKEDFGPLSNSPVLLLFSPVKMLLTMFLFQKRLGRPFPEDVWAWWLLMHWLQLPFTPCEALPSVWIVLCLTVFISLRSSLLLVLLFLPNFVLPVLPHYCAFKEQVIPGIYTVWMVIYWNSNAEVERIQKYSTQVKVPLHYWNFT